MRMMAQCLCCWSQTRTGNGFLQVYRENFRRMSALAVRLWDPAPKRRTRFMMRFEADSSQRTAAGLESGADRGMVAVVVKNTALDMLRREKRETELEESGGCRLFRRMRADFRHWWL